MSSIVPSYLLKLKRAKVHLAEVERLVGRYADRHPYEMRKEAEDEHGRCLSRLVFTEQPDDDIAIVAGDVIHNVRSGLNHLAASIVPEERRRQVQFPIFSQDPFEVDSKTGRELMDRRLSREVWKRFTKGMPEGATTFIKSVQPYAAMWTVDNSADGFSLIEKLSNNDKHRKLIVLATGLKNARAEYTWPNGYVVYRTAIGDLKDGARDATPIPSEVNVKIDGTVAIAANLGEDSERPGQPHIYELVGTLRTCITTFEKLAIPGLIPFVVA